MYIYGWICLDPSVCSWIGGQRGDLITGIFEVALECPEDLPLSILAWRPHRELCPRKIWRLEETDEGWRTAVNWEMDSEAVSQEWDSEVGELES